MSFNSHLTEFGPYRVVAWEPGDALPDVTATIPRLALDYEDPIPWPDKLAALLARPGSEGLRGLVVGAWEDAYKRGPEDVVRALADAAPRLPNLRALFFGDITSEEYEISWITSTDLSPVLEAFPRLTHLGVRGTNGLSLGRLDLPRLETLVIQTGGLDASILREVLGADLPNLRILELYLGTENYGATVAVDDLAPLLDGERFPKLRELGLRDSEIADEIAAVLAHAPILERLEVLDLSLGTLSDDGARALLGSPSVRGLRKLDLHHHWISDELVEELRKLPLLVNVSDQQDPDDDWRFVAVGE